MGNSFGPNTIAPGVWYRAEVTLDRHAGSFDLNVTEKVGGKLYWHPGPVLCGKVNAEQRGMNLIQFSAFHNGSDQDGVFIDSIKVTVGKE
jgi:hypothetical protein